MITCRINCHVFLAAFNNGFYKTKKSGVIMTGFQFTDTDFVEIREIWRDINVQCQILQDRTGCPNSEIVKMIDSAKSYWENKE